MRVRACPAAAELEDAEDATYGYADRGDAESVQEGSEIL